MSIFRPADIMIPQNLELEKWSVVACDQFTSQPEYWEEVSEIVGDSPSTLNLVYPEAFLSEDDARIEKINTAMDNYIESGIFKTYPNSFFLTERTLSGGRVKKGLIGQIDLEEYDFNKGSKSAVRATEGTVIERIPPRVKIRQGAPLELPHIIILINDPEDKVMKSVSKGNCLYDFELMQSGGNLKGFIVTNNDDVIGAIEEYENSAEDGFSYAVGDGNHSLATAKTCWENIKPTLSDEERKTHPARFCLCEIENIHNKAIEFEPIHRVVFGCNPEKLISDFKSSVSLGEGQVIEYSYGNTKGKISLNCEGLAVGELQKFLDKGNFEIDYIHGADVAVKLAEKPNTCAFLLPSPDKSALFKSVIADGALPRKTFSMGEANEKRYYMEAKMIK